MVDPEQMVSDLLAGYLYGDLKVADLSRQVNDLAFDLAERDYDHSLVSQAQLLLWEFAEGHLAEVALRDLLAPLARPHAGATSAKRR